MRRLSPEEAARRLAAGRIRADRQSRRLAGRPPSPALQQAIDRAHAALLLVVRDIESTTPIRWDAGIQLYEDWVSDWAQSPQSWLLHGPDDEEGDDTADEEVELVVACYHGGHSFSLGVNQSAAEITGDIAAQLQDDVIDELQRAWPACAEHQHPLSPEVVGGVAVWTCPTDAGVSAPIGQLGGVAGGLPPP